MKEVLMNILRAFMEAAGLNIEWQINLMPYLITLAFVLIVAGFYAIAWSRVNFYTGLMDRYLRELWSREEYDVRKPQAKGDLKRMRLDRLKREYRDRIDDARYKRDRILKVTPLLKWWYKKRKGQSSPMFTLPD